MRTHLNTYLFGSDNTKKIDQAARLLKTIAHPIRVRIILTLVEQPSVSVSTLQYKLTIEQPVLSKHLIKMKDQGILDHTRKGKEIYYFLAEPTFNQIGNLLLKAIDKGKRANR